MDITQVKSCTLNIKGDDIKDMKLKYYKLIKNNEAIGITKGTGHSLTTDNLQITIFNDNEIITVIQIKDFKQIDNYTHEIYLQIKKHILNTKDKGE